MGSTVSTSVIKRLPRYYRFLQELMNNGVTRISSRELSEKMVSWDKHPLSFLCMRLEGFEPSSYSVRSGMPYPLGYRREYKKPTALAVSNGNGNVSYDIIIL